MLKKVIVSAFIGMVLITPLSASAIGNEPARDVRSSLSVENNTANRELSAQVSSNDISEAKSTVSQSRVVDKSEPILPTGWLLTMALFGFVILSNRSGI